jgi:hypothetical protein
VRLGGDVDYQLAGFTLQGEVISVNEPLTPEQQMTLRFIAQMDPRVGTGLDKLFFYGNLSYDFTDNAYAYVGYECLDNNIGADGPDPVTGYTLGGGFRPIESIVLKAQYFHFRTVIPGIYETSMNRGDFAVSVFF